MTQPIPSPIVETMPTEKMPYHHKKRRAVIMLIAVLVVILAVAGWYLWKKHHVVAVATPAQTLENLRTTSGPDTKTIMQKSATMNALEKTSKKTSVTNQQQLDMLNALSK